MVEDRESTASRTSPPTERVMAVLDFLARHRTERFGLSELARRLGLSKPTCLGIVTTLAESGFLIRDDRDKTYSLGPALIRIGRAAQESLRAKPASRDQLLTLTREFGHTAALSAVVSDRVTVLEVVSDPDHPVRVEVGQSYPFTPPVGLMFVLWDTDETVAAWLAKDPTTPGRTADDRLRKVIEECRTDGYLVELLTPAGRQLYSLMAGVPGDIPNELRALLGEIVSGIGERVYLRSENYTVGSGAKVRHRVNVISAPVYDHNGKQAMVASLYIADDLTDAEITTRAKALVLTADGITEHIGGVKPA